MKKNKKIWHTFLNKKYESYYSLSRRHFQLDFQQRKLNLKVGFVLKCSVNSTIWRLFCCTLLKTFEIDKFSKKIFDFDISSKSLHGRNLDKQYHFGWAKVLPIKPNHKLNNAKFVTDRKSEKMIFFLNFELFFGISLVLPLNLSLFQNNIQIL